MVDGGILGEFGRSIWGILVHLGKSISWNPPQNTDSHPCTRPPSWGIRGILGDTSGQDRGSTRGAVASAREQAPVASPTSNSFYSAKRLLRKIIGKITIIIMAIFCHFMVKLDLNNIFNILIGFSRSGLV